MKDANFSRVVDAIEKNQIKSTIGEVLLSEKQKNKSFFLFLLGYMFCLSVCLLDMVLNPFIVLN